MEGHRKITWTSSWLGWRNHHGSNKPRISRKSAEGWPSSYSPLSKNVGGIVTIIRYTQISYMLVIGIVLYPHHIKSPSSPINIPLNPMNFPWISHEFPMKSPWNPHEIPVSPPELLAKFEAKDLSAAPAPCVSVEARRWGEHHGKTYGKTMGKPWENHGKIMGKPRKTMVN